MSVEVDPVTPSPFGGLAAPDRTRSAALPRAAELSAQAAAEIEALVPRSAESVQAPVVITPWGGPYGSLGQHLAHRHHRDGTAPVEVTPLDDRPSVAGANTIVISGSVDASDWLAPRVSEFRRACMSVVDSATEGQAIILASPVYVGATRDLLIRPLEARGFVVGRDIHVAFCPIPGGDTKREAPRRTVVGGATSGCALVAAEAVNSLGPLEVVATPEEAEALALAALPRSRVGAAVKRASDMAIASAGLVLIIPIVLVVALAILLDDGGPIVFTQERIGRNGRPFRMRKFRTMVKGAEERLDEVAAMNEIRGPAFQIDRDPRLTRIGGFLRRSSIDELPQLWNVLYGDMSLVGPRPAPPVEVAAYEPWHRGRLTTRPGITGLAQVRARSYRDFDEKASLDLEYIVRWSLWLDFEIMLRSVPVVLRLTGR